MRKLRQQYDLVRRQVEAKEEELSRVKRKLEHQQNEEYFIEDDVFQKSNSIQESLTESQKIKEASEFELMKQRQYKHMIQRIQQDLIAMKIKVSRKQESY